MAIATHYANVRHRYTAKNVGYQIEPLRREVIQQYNDAYFKRRYAEQWEQKKKVNMYERNLQTRGMDQYKHAFKDLVADWQKPSAPDLAMQKPPNPPTAEERKQMEEWANRLWAPLRAEEKKEEKKEEEEEEFGPPPARKGIFPGFFGRGQHGSGKKSKSKPPVRHLKDIKPKIMSEMDKIKHEGNILAAKMKEQKVTDPLKKLRRKVRAGKKFKINDKGIKSLAKKILSVNNI